MSNNQWSFVDSIRKTVAINRDQPAEVLARSILALCDELERGGPPAAPRVYESPRVELIGNTNDILHHVCSPKEDIK